MKQAAETVVAKRQISLWTEKEKSAFMDAYKVPATVFSFGLPRHPICCKRYGRTVPAQALAQLNTSLC